MTTSRLEKSESKQTQENTGVETTDGATNGSWLKFTQGRCDLSNSILLESELRRHTQRECTVIYFADAENVQQATRKRGVKTEAVVPERMKT